MVRWALLLLCFPLSILLAFSSETSPPPIGKVLALKGEVHFTTSMGDHLQASLEDPVFQGMKISTGKQAYLKIVLNDQSQLTLGPESTVLVNLKSFFSSQDQVTLLTLFEGQLRAAIKHQLRKLQRLKFAVRTPTAVLGVRGTEFQVRYQASERQSQLLVESGVVAFNSNPYELSELTLAELEQLLEDPNAVLVRANQYSEILAARYPSSPRLVASMKKMLIEGSSVEQVIQPSVQLPVKLQRSESVDWVQTCLIRAEISARKVVQNGVRDK